MGPLLFGTMVEIARHRRPPAAGLVALAVAIGQKVTLPNSWRCSESYCFVSQRLAIRQATVKAGLKTLPTS
jgi:hypothetical protein